MKRSASLSRTLVFYDTPQLFVASDAVGTDYLCLLVEQHAVYDVFAAVAVSPGRLHDFLKGREDLRPILADPEDGVRYRAHIPSGTTLGDFVIEDVEQFPSEWLPDDGFTLDYTELEDAGATAEAAERNRAVVALALSPPETRTDLRIDAYRLAEGVALFQSVVKYGYKKAISNLTAAARQVMSDPDNYRMNVYAFSRGSFTVHFESKIPADLLGYVNIEHAFRTLDAVMADLRDPQAATDVLRQYHGHFATALKALLEYVVENRTAISYEWANPEMRAPVRREMSVARAAELYEHLNKIEGISDETVTLVGRVTKASTETGEWLLRSMEDNRRYHGYIDEGANVSLEGIILKTRVYRFVCREQLVGFVATGAERRRLWLRSYEPA